MHRNSSALTGIERLKSSPTSAQYRLEGLAVPRSMATAGALPAMKRVPACFAKAVATLLSATERHSRETGPHLRRIGKYVDCITRELGWSSCRRQWFQLVAPLHDVGKIGVPPVLLHRPGPLNERERAIVRSHTFIGHAMLSGAPHPDLREASLIALTHHERWDGSGYPNGLAGESIPITGRIIALADTYDALRMPRSYKPAFDHQKALSIMLEGDDRTSPAHFEPELLTMLVKLQNEFCYIYDSSPH